MTREQIIAKAELVRDRYTDRITHVLAEFQQELEQHGHYRGSLYQWGYLAADTMASPIGTCWFLRDQLLWLHVSTGPVNSKRIVTLEFPLHRDIGMYKGWEERLRQVLRKKYLG